MEDVNKTRRNNDSYNFLLLSLYYYLKKNNFKQTSEKLFKECKLDQIFKFPENLPPPKNEKEKLTNQFIEYFYKNSFENPNFDLLSDFWNQFWRIFANKMNMGNNRNKETLFEKEEKNISKISYSPTNISSNYLNNNLNSFNIDNLNTINNLTNINKNTNNNINTDEMINIINSSNEHFNTNTNMNINNNNNYINDNKIKNIINKDENINNYGNLFSQNKNENNNNNNIIIEKSSNTNKMIMEKAEKQNINQVSKNRIDDEEEEEEEGDNDIEKEMDEANGILFNNKNSPNIIKRTNGEEMPAGIYSNEHDNDIGKNIFPSYPPNSLSNLNFNNNGTGAEERNMSAIPLAKDVNLGNYENNNHEFDM